MGRITYAQPYGRACICSYVRTRGAWQMVRGHMSMAAVNSGMAVPWASHEWRMEDRGRNAVEGRILPGTCTAYRCQICCLKRPKKDIFGCVVVIIIIDPSCAQGATAAADSEGMGACPTQRTALTPAVLCSPAARQPPYICEIVPPAISPMIMLMPTTWRTTEPDKRHRRVGDGRRALDRQASQQARLPTVPTGKPIGRE